MSDAPKPDITIRFPIDAEFSPQFRQEVEQHDRALAEANAHTKATQRPLTGIELRILELIEGEPVNDLAARHLIQAWGYGMAVRRTRPTSEDQRERLLEAARKIVDGDSIISPRCAAWIDETSKDRASCLFLALTARKAMREIAEAAPRDDP